ncbi:uncharacterized protein LOC117649367 isoform X2 [Thrips palmi]|uniref:Uncharacterized protein LOC117649367 isoform X2 n=1 Tax=Thrips palmi TaxID=161013 RepID=A0A6P8ZS78_THRPL|nr:uncharacterized protein LOC117649367 isoform X2 [Thrips palmi]
MLVSLSVGLLLALLPATRAWDFNGVVPQDAPVVSVAVWENRAFLAVPRVWRDPRDALDKSLGREWGRGRGRAKGRRGSSSGSLTFIHDGPTLLEAPWPEPRDVAVNATGRASSWMRSRRLAAVRAFPRLEEQAVGDRARLQSVTAVAVESGRGAARLWVLDSGEEPSNSLARCSPKIVVFNLRGNNQKVWLRQFDGLPPGAVSGLAVDPTASDTRAYVGHPDVGGGGTIIVLSWKGKSFWKLRLNGMEAGPQPQPPRAPRRRAPVKCGPPPCWDIAFMQTAKRTPRMVIMPRDAQGIFDVALGALRGPAPDAEHRNDALVAAAELGVRRLARKPTPCPSCGLLGEPSGGLLYFLIGADGGGVVRWDPRRGAGERGHSVIYSDNASLPLSAALFLDAQGAAWAACTTFAEHRDDDLDDREEEVEVDAEDYEEDDEENEYHDAVARPPPRPARRRHRFPRGVRWTSVRSWNQDNDDEGSGQDDLDGEDDEHAAEPQEYVCMSPVANPVAAAAPCAKADKRSGGFGPSSRPRGSPKALDDANTMMVTRRREHGRHSDRDDDGVAGAHRNVLIEDGDDAPAARTLAVPRSRTAARAALRPTVHCVRLQWSDREDDDEEEVGECQRN